MENENVQKTEMKFNEEMVSLLATTSKWSKFLAIVNYVFIGIFLLLGIFMMAMGPMFSAVANASGALPAGFFVTYGITIIILVIIDIFPTYWLYQFAARAKRAIADNDEATMTEAFVSMKNFWAFNGIMTIVALAIMVFSIIIMAIISIATFSAV